MKSKQKILVLLAFIALVAVGYVYTNKYLADKHYKVFKIAMDKAIEKGSWTNKSYKYNLLSRNFSVQGMVVDLKNNEKLGIKGDLKITIDDFSIKSSLKKDDVEALLATENWVNKAKLDIASSIKLTGLKYFFSFEDFNNTKSIDIEEVIEENTAEIVEEKIVVKTEKGPSGEFSYEEIIYENVSLNASGNDSLEGILGFIKNLSIDSIRSKNIDYTINVLNEDVVVKIHLDNEELNKLSFPQLSLGVEDLLTFFSAKSYTANNITFSTEKLLNESNKESTSLVLKLDKIDIKDIENTFDFSSLALNNFSLNFDNKLLMNYEKFLITDFNGSTFLEKVNKSIANHSVENFNSYELFRELYNDIFPISMYLSSGFSYDTIELDKLDLSYEGHKYIAMDSFNLKGPIKAYELIKNSTLTVNNFLITLPDNEDFYENDEPLKIIKYLSPGGIEINLKATTKYDEATSSLTYTLNDLSLNNLFSLNFSYSLGGITQKLFDRLSDKSILELGEMLDTNVDAVYDLFEGFKLNEFNISVKDLGVLNKAYEYTSKNKLKGLTPDQVKNDFVTSASFGISLAGKGYIENSDKIGQLIGDFLSGNKNITLVSNPNTGLSIKDFDGMSEVKILNNLNMSLSLNDGDKLPLVFIDRNAKADDAADDDM